MQKCRRIGSFWFFEVRRFEFLETRNVTFLVPENPENPLATVNQTLNPISLNRTGPELRRLTLSSSPRTLRPWLATTIFRGDLVLGAPAILGAEHRAMIWGLAYCIIHDTQVRLFCGPANKVPLSLVAKSNAHAPFLSLA